MQKTRIDWCDYTTNPVKGLCPMDCKDLEGKPYCYARKIYKRFHFHKDGTVNPTWDYEIRWDEETFVNAFGYFTCLPPNSKTFVGSTMELFGDWVKVTWLRRIFDGIRLMPDRTFIFLTKQPQNLVMWSPFPQNCWVGVSAVGMEMWLDAVQHLHTIEAPVKFVSVEPFLYEIYLGAFDFDKDGINWLILGCQTPMSKKTLPRREWVDEIISATDKAGIPVFCKEPMASHFGINRKEFPAPRGEM